MYVYCTYTLLYWDSNQCFFFMIAMIDSLGGPNRVNNFLSTLNIKPIDQKNLKSMERRAGQKIEEVAKRSMELAATDTYKLEME